MAEQTGVNFRAYLDYRRFYEATPPVLKDLALCQSLLRVVESHLSALRGGITVNDGGDVEIW